MAKDAEISRNSKKQTTRIRLSFIRYYNWIFDWLQNILTLHFLNVKSIRNSVKLVSLQIGYFTLPLQRFVCAS